MPNIMKKNPASKKMLFSAVNESITVVMSFFIEGIAFKLLNGLNSLKVLSPLTLERPAKLSRLLTTTLKSSQFQVSRR